MSRTALFGVAALAVCAIVAGCSSGTPRFTLDGGTVDATFACPVGSDNAPYPLHARVEAHNPTKAAVTIRSVTATLKLQTIKGPWLEKVGSTYDAGSAIFTPANVPAGASASIEVTITSACTSDKSILAPLSYGEYLVYLRVTTSSGSFTVSGKNRHRIVAT